MPALLLQSYRYTKLHYYHSYHTSPIAAHFPGHITIPAYILMPDFSNFALVISNMFDGLAVALLNQFQGTRIQQRDKTIFKLQADNDRLRQQAIITDIQVDLLKRIATSRQNPRQRRTRSRNPRRAIAASAM